MRELILDGRVVEDAWTLLPADADDALVRATAQPVVPFSNWQHWHERGLLAHTALGICVNTNDDPRAIAELITVAAPRLVLIAIRFDTFKDGRGYSLAALLRGRHGFTGELRAIGEVLQDQLFYLQRVGFNAFSIAATGVGRDASSALRGLSDFSESYQASSDQPVPLFQRRAAHASSGPLLGVLS